MALPEFQISSAISRTRKVFVILGQLSSTPRDKHMAKHYEDWHTLFPNSGKGKEFPWMWDVLMRLQPKTVLDYGCGKGGTADYLESKIQCKIDRYDPGYAPYSVKPTQQYELVYSTDVFEHIEREDIPATLEYINTLATQYTAHIIDLDPARKKLPDGRNAHVTLLTPDEWLAELEPYGEVVQYEVRGYEDKYLPQRTRLHVICLAHS